LISLLGLASFGCNSSPSSPKHDLPVGRYFSQSLPGSWRPFSDDSPWNTPIAPDAATHPESQDIIGLATSLSDHLRLVQIYAIPVWVGDSDSIPPVRVRSDYVFDWWDQNPRDGWTDVGAPLVHGLWTGPTDDGHLCIIDPRKQLAWEMSHFLWLSDGTPTCTTFNIWDLQGSGVGSPDDGPHWQLRGGRGSGFPLIAGLLRPEELAAGEIRHALVFTFFQNRRSPDGAIFLPPACRSDGWYMGSEYPIEGMRWQLDPSLGETDFAAWGLNREGLIVARALQKYGMLDGDNGGNMALQMQLLGPTATESLAKWEALFPGFYANVERIPVASFRAVDTGEPVKR
jgi:hypothetical protein